jgi:phospholipase C
VGASQQFSATGFYNDGSTQNLTNSVTWNSSSAQFASINSSGLASGLSSGSTNITATSGSVSGGANLTVTNAALAAIAITPQDPSIPPGSTERFTAKGTYTDGTSADVTANVTWSSSFATVATISNASGSQGLATSIGTGATIITAALGSLTDSTSLSVVDQLVSITVTPSEAMVAPGVNQQFTAIGTYSSGLTQNLTNSVLWTSSSSAVATVNASGLAMSVGAGQSVVGASLGPINGSAALAVTPIQHVVVIFQENRTPDNLFQGLPNADIASSGINSQGQVIPLAPAAMKAAFGGGHDHLSFLLMWDNGKMDGADKIPVGCNGPCPPNPMFTYVRPSDTAPYMQLAQQYTFGDRMFQTNQGPSFPAHQFIISGTSAPTQNSDLFAAENTSPNNEDAGCEAPANVTVNLIDPTGNESQTQYPCFDHTTLVDLLDAQGVSWRYYTPSAGSIWTGPNAIQHLRFGSDWNNVILLPSQVLTDISSGHLPAVSWVIPTGLASDHPRLTDGSGPSWVASVVNAIGNSPYWANTAIFITWDDWGGFYDHVPPPVFNSYEYGFRVPLIVVSPYAKPAYVSHITHDFGSILKFIEQTYNLPSLGYADVLADDLTDCFNFNQTPLVFNQITAPLGREFFLNDKRPPTPPDDD